LPAAGLVAGTCSFGSLALSLSRYRASKLASLLSDIHIPRLSSEDDYILLSNGSLLDMSNGTFLLLDNGNYAM
jgi:hypothetical protein